MFGLLGWTVAMGIIVVLGSILMVICFVKAGKEFEFKKEITMYYSRAGAILFVIGLLILVGLIFCSIKIGNGYLAEDKLPGHLLERYGIYEVVGKPVPLKSKWIVNLKDQRGTPRAYLMDAVPPKIFKVVPIRKGKKWVHEYRLYQGVVSIVYTPQVEEPSVKTDTNQQQDNPEIQE